MDLPEESVDGDSRDRPYWVQGPATGPNWAGREDRGRRDRARDNG